MGYQSLKLHEKDLDDDQRVELINLKRKLVLKKGDDQLRVIPQIQNNNQNDYKAVLSDVGVISSFDTPAYAGNRKIFRAFRYFQARIEEMVERENDRLASIMAFLDKVSQACLVKIEVASHADAYTLFESLNNRGMPLTAIDLIKNKLLARLETTEPGKVDHYFDVWNKLLGYLGDDYSVQERFFRHYYNAFKDPLNVPFRKEDDKKKDPLGPVATPDVTLPADRVPVFYLPGVSRQDLRAIEDCPDLLKPLAELQYRGVIWSQANAKDWTIMAFLKSDQGGMGLDVAQDNDAKNAMQLALYRLLDEELELLKGKRLDKDYFNTLLTGGDPVRDLLQWLDMGDAFQTTRGTNEWKAFVEVCKSQLAFNPQADGVLAGAHKLALHEGPWHSVWERYSEAPKRYPNIPSRIRQCKPPIFDLFVTAESAGGWPQWNEDQEKSLQHDLLALNHLPAHDARKRVLDLEKTHAPRRELVWAELGESPLALAIKHLAVVAEVSKTALAAGSVSDLQAGYAAQGWLADDAVLSALACAEKPADVDAVTAAIRAIYLPWLEESARYLQKLVDGSNYPGGTITSAKAFAASKGECVLFVDGLRFDAARRLSAVLETRGCQVAEAMSWTALPSVTATGKAAASPVRTKISGTDDCDDFEPCVSATGQSLKGGYHLKKLLNDNHWKVLDRIVDARRHEVDDLYLASFQCFGLKQLFLAGSHRAGLELTLNNFQPFVDLVLVRAGAITSKHELDDVGGYRKLATEGAYQVLPD